ncbi:MAG TPA: 30S ribosomal protein S8 [Actinomycetota bacterium]|jgi:small subunit ribosomal protein S8|nr:30S ribosomal protein S8 [Actinomycetota bacterium]
MVKALVRTNVTDPVADMLTRIRNANVAYKDDLLVPASKLNQAILKILAAEGFVDGFETEGEGVHQALRVRLKYGAKRERTITGLRRISTPGRRVYAVHDKLPRVMGGLGIAILSTSQGVITDRVASRRGIGGEVLAYVW